MIIGTGIDIVAIKRIRDAEAKWGRRFLDRVFTEGEIKYAFIHKSPYIYLAARFAAKEAMMKALGTGLINGLKWKDVEVINKESGRPEVVLHGKVKDIATHTGVTNIHLSISHDGEYAIAHVLLER
ncbi:MAG: holo-ACP synthase [Nitrospirae bacterium]|nr:holo-ACP synthase [Nitrospirota bacterium]